MQEGTTHAFMHSIWLLLIDLGTVDVHWAACYRFTEILSCAEGLTEDQVKQAIRKSRIMYNR
jgi:hypothetical protein